MMEQSIPIYYNKCCDKRGTDAMEAELDNVKVLPKVRP